MHIQSHFEESRTQVLHDLIHAKPLATLIIIQEGDIVVNHMPLTISPDEGKYGTLRGHMPRRNPIWESFNETMKAVAVFHGPSAYISPSWYPSKRKDGQAVPTWNYVVAHAHGCPKAIHDPIWLLDHLTEMTNEQETAQPLPWKVSDAPERYIEKMMEHIVGIEMPITSLRGKWKVSQNKSEEDRIGVISGLQDQGDDNSLAVEALVRQSIDKLEKD